MTNQPLDPRMIKHIASNRQAKAYAAALAATATEFQMAPEDVEDAAGTETSRDAAVVLALRDQWRAEHEAAEIASMNAIRDAERRNESILAGEYSGTLPGDEAEDAADAEYAEMLADLNPAQRRNLWRDASPKYNPLDDEPDTTATADRPAAELPF